tara:strand:- start:709 stop:906 length:198 start_codon:yes stop_codon:yes gene_type:complete
MSNPIEVLLLPKKQKKKKVIKMHEIFNGVKNDKTIHVKIFDEETSVNGSEKQKKYNAFIQDHREV